jgi:hypothetical protein
VVVVVDGPSMSDKGEGGGESMHRSRRPPVRLCC